METSATTPVTTPVRLTPAARRILDVAGELFYAHGIAAIGVDTIAAESGVTKRTLYDRFGSKDTLVAAYLGERDQRWRARIADRLDEIGSDPAARILAPFDVLGPWLDDSPRGCRMINAYAELPDPENPARILVLAEKSWLRARFHTEAVALGVAAPDDLAVALLALHEGALVGHAMAGAVDAAAQVAAAARTLVAAAGDDRPRSVG